MRSKVVAGWGLAVVAAMAWSVPAAGQGRPGTDGGATAGTWTPPRTPWGDPDLQGSFTNKSEQGTPFERPSEFEGRKLEDVSGEELAEILEERQEEVIERGRPPGSENVPHAPFHWSDRFEVAKGGQAWFVVDPADGQIPPLTPEGQARQAARAAERRAGGRGSADSYEDRSLYDRCISRGLPTSMLPTIYGNSYQILQGPGYVAIRYEMIHETRVIPIEDRPHLPTAIREYMGDARGRWEGDTLVVETTNFKPETTYRNANAETLKLVERFTRVAPDKVLWRVTVDDPTTWTRPWTFQIPLTQDEREAVFEYACHEGNRGLMNILSGARAEERAR